MIRKIAMITPWPDERTGIADYAFDLVHGLATSGVEVDVFTTSNDASSNHSRVTVHDLDHFAGGNGYDQTVYQMGNCSTFHGPQLPVLTQYPGVVHLHDPALHHLMAFFLYRNDVQDQSKMLAYYDVLRTWYGPAVADWILKYNETDTPLFWDGPYVNEVPFFDPVLACATGCIVHSQFAQKSIGKRFPELEALKFPQLYRGMTPSCSDRMEQDTIQVGIFGIVQPHKHVDIVLEAVKACAAKGSKIHLHVGGSLQGTCETLPQFARNLGIQDSVTFYGRMEEEAFLDKMRNVDVCISLRYPTMGETSAIVSRALQLGLPTIVNDVGWYAELPECVVKLPVDKNEMRQRLTQELSRLSEDSSRLPSWKQRCRKYASSACSYERGIQDYIQLLNHFRSPLPLQKAG
ncbi:D-inositol-3-phosphate glycosyltransferase [Bremerella volcania]|uniref:D-inositol-3-phosphate glycosyltransferase n=1 Tax=Bremerella volcania TaxID=2527984 RepID=A0A518C382_9BACT|nr:glycosyltransferase [Bremerella volcania]QDU73679.1 D-inositol-3-phosphate glycosyltransferase [Bremerella volcania]